MTHRVFQPPDYRWVGPLIDVHIGDEPDAASAQTHLLYDYWAGRLGSDTTVSVGGSDDDTLHQVQVSTEVVVELNGLPPTIHQMTAATTWECQGTFADIVSEHEEYGVSDVGFSWTSQPYSRLEGQAKGSPAPVLPFFSASATGSDGPFSPDEIDSSIPPAIQAGHPESREFKYDDVAPERVIRLVVGVRDEVRVSSNDWSYAAHLHSHWILSSIDVGYA